MIFSLIYSQCYLLWKLFEILRFICLTQSLHQPPRCSWTRKSAWSLEPPLLPKVDLHFAAEAIETS
jgi:hypothetical protein